jgi:predicted DsbA family dithiol-disulfide isomerase
VVLAHRMAMESDKILAEAIEATEFPDLSRKYRVMAVPRTVVNDQAVIEGAMPESMFIDRIFAAVGDSIKKTQSQEESQIE